MLIVGDTHSKNAEYLRLVKDEDFSLQLGDFGFGEDYQVLSCLDPNKHKILLGNHDDYPLAKIGPYPHFLGDFGPLQLGYLQDAFYVRGGRSIDWSLRTPGIDFFEEEELTYQQGMKCIELYDKTKPRIVFSHECPLSVIDIFPKKTWGGSLIRPSHTSHILQSMLDIHQPELWMFGHFHESRNQLIGRCIFVCLKELETYRL